MKKILVSNIQRFSLHDGPGIRTTVFLKGCSLKCPWCSNPENLTSQPQHYNKDGICGTYGVYYDAESLAEECLKDKSFYDDGIGDWNISKAEDIELLPGGVTFSGGEALLQMEALVLVCEQLHKKGVHITVETSLFVSPHNLLLSLNYIDFFYVDIKILDENRVKAIEHGDIRLYYRNFDMIMNSNKPIVIRIPVIGGKTDNTKNRESVKRLLEQYKGKYLKIELIKEHNLAESKYKSLNMQMDYQGVSDELMNQYQTELLNLDVPVEICKI